MVSKRTNVWMAAGAAGIAGADCSVLFRLDVRSRRAQRCAALWTVPLGLGTGLERIHFGRRSALRRCYHPAAEQRTGPAGQLLHRLVGLAAELSACGEPAFLRLREQHQHRLDFHVCCRKLFASCEGEDVLVKGCNMTYGSSGGAWVSNTSRTRCPGTSKGWSAARHVPAVLGKRMSAHASAATTWACFAPPKSAAPRLKMAITAAT